MNTRVQAALMASGLVLGHYAFVDHAVNDWNRGLVGRLGRLFVAGVTRFDDILDSGAHQGTQAHVVLAGFLRLPSAFPC